MIEVTLTEIAESIILAEPELTAEITRLVNRRSAIGMGLTGRQLDLLEFIKSYISQHDIAPTYAEMRDGLNLASTSGVNRLVLDLERRGAIRRLPGRVRAIEVVRVSA